MIYLKDYKYKLLKKVESKTHAYLTYQNENEKELLVTVDKRRHRFSVDEVLFTNNRVWLSTIANNVSEIDMKKMVYETVRGIFV